MGRTQKTDKGNTMIIFLGFVGLLVRNLKILGSKLLIDINQIVNRI